MEVPLPRACSRRLMSFFTFHISMFFSASLACGALIVSEVGENDHSSSRRILVCYPFQSLGSPYEEMCVVLRCVLLCCRY